MKQITNIEEGTSFFTENKAIISLYENLPSDFIVADAVVKDKMNLHYGSAEWKESTFTYYSEIEDISIDGNFLMTNVDEYEVHDFTVTSPSYVISSDDLTPVMRNMIREEIQESMVDLQLFQSEWLEHESGYGEQMREDYERENR